MVIACLSQYINSATISHRTKRDAETTSENKDSSVNNQGNTIPNTVSGIDFNSVIQQMGVNPVDVFTKFIKYVPKIPS